MTEQRRRGGREGEGYSLSIIYSYFYPLSVELGLKNNTVFHEMKVLVFTLNSTILLVYTESKERESAARTEEKYNPIVASLLRSPFYVCYLSTCMADIATVTQLPILLLTVREMYKLHLPRTATSPTTFCMITESMLSNNKLLSYDVTMGNPIIIE